MVANGFIREHLYHKRVYPEGRSGKFSGLTPNSPLRGKGEDMKTGICGHVTEIRKVKPSGSGCKECLEMGDEWVHLRLCLSCGHVGCCDSSKNKHATKHFHHTKHPIVQSFEPGEDWRWCFVRSEEHTSELQSH